MAGNYWHKIRHAVFTSGIIQHSGRHMKLSIGDVMTGFHAGQDIQALYEKAFPKSEWRAVNEDRLIEGFPTVFGMVFENMPRALAIKMNNNLLSHKGYLGALSVHLEYGPHLALYRLRLPPQYRLQGSMIRSFYKMGEEDDCDQYDLDEMKNFGYTDAAFEDSGASRTILDDFDTPRHFQRVATFRNLLKSMLAGGEDDAYELTMLLEDLSPKLFNALGAATERLKQAENEEDVAQVAISGRRYVEQLADALFPPTNVKRGKRRLDKPSYKNRLWAFVEDETEGEPARLSEIGKRIDNTVDELNAGLHGEMTKERVAAALADAAQLTATLFSLNPKASRSGYLGYQRSLNAFVQELFQTKERS